MLDQTIPGHAPGDPDSLKQALLALLIYDHPGLWSLTELDRSLTPSGSTRAGHEPASPALEDAVEDLYAAGLIHRLGDFVFATRAAHQAQRLAG